MKNFLVFAIAMIFLIPLARTVAAAPTVRPTEIMVRVPFKGTLQSTEIYGNSLRIMSVSANGSGNATQIGQFTIRYQSEVNLLDLSAIETAQFMGTDGDSLQARGIGQVTENRTPGMFNLIEIYTITGGTGRFAGASGTVTLNRLISITTGATSSTFEGYILMP
ncbi:MAG TPA: hypothetical protein VKB04_10905 [Anaerolineales bacterium]|nr:hypothetical protein [Anaerolineales bacterium]